MKKITSFRLVCFLFIFSFSVKTNASILPPNQFYIFDRLNVINNITEAQFNKVIDEIIDYYQPLSLIYGAKLAAEKNWTDPTVNAYASQNADHTKWTISMFGGLARRAEVTLDGFTLVVCHELGHHFGGFPFKGERWAATEGQSDYYATQACARSIWRNKIVENSSYALAVDPIIQSECDKSWKEENDRNICYRTAEAGLSLANLLAALGGSGAPHFDTPDTRQVTSTNESHPNAQCRLDTYFFGGLCKNEFHLEEIPGKNFPDGQESLGAEHEAATQSCMAASGYDEGQRPRCWFKPRI